MSAIPAPAREKVRFRDFGRCARCSAHAAHDIHHRMRRREGGHDLSNMVLLCRKDHEWAHRNPELARKEGFIVSVYDDPRSIPLRTWRGWMRLDDEGTLAFVAPARGGTEKEEA